MKFPILALSLLGLVSMAASLRAQSVDFVRNIPLPQHSAIIPLRTDLAITPYVYLVASNQLWTMAPGESSFELVDQGLSGVKANQFSTVMLDNADPSAQNLAFYGLNSSIYEYSLNDLSFTNILGPNPQLEYIRLISPFGAGHGILLDRRDDSIGGDTGKSVIDINLLDGTRSLLFDGLNNAWNIQGSSDGGIWVLDNNKTQLEKFTLTSGVWSATTSFSISGTFDGTMALASSGELLLGDGLGGGSLYSPDGTLLQSFSPPSTTVFDPVSTGYGTPYINIDSTGLITLYANTVPSVGIGQGMYNIYQFSSVPEPSTSGALVAALLASLIALRLRKPSRVEIPDHS